MASTVSQRHLLIGGAALLGVTALPPVWSVATPATPPIPALVDATDGEPVDQRIRNAQ